MSVQAIYAKRGTKLYRVELTHKFAGFFVLRPISGRAYQVILATAQQLKNDFRLFPIAGKQS